MDTKILDLDKTTIDLYKKCFDNNESPKSLDIIKWQFFENNSKNFVDIEHDFNADKTAAIYATFGVKFKINKEIYLGSQSLDTITDIDYRGKGLFIKLAKDVYEKAAAQNTVLVYGFPNGNSIHGFANKLGWKQLGPVPFLIKPLKTKYFTDKIKFLKFMPNLPLSFNNYKKNNYDVRLEDGFKESVNGLWENFSKNIKVSVNRDKEYLDWRYNKKPGENYKIAAAYLDGRQIGLVVFTTKEKHNGKIGYIMELIYDLENPKVAKQLLNFAVSEIKKEKADCILAWSLEHSPSYAVFSKKWFLNMPEKIRPIELHFGCRAFDEKLDTLLSARENWYLSYSDSDTV